MHLINSDFLNIVELCDSYVTLQRQLEKVLSSGRFQLTQGRKYDSMPSSPSSFNRVFESSVSVDVNADTADFELFVGKPDVAPLLLMNPLPTPALKSAANTFSRSLQDIILIANTARRIRAALEALDSKESAEDDVPGVGYVDEAVTLHENM